MRFQPDQDTNLTEVAKYVEAQTPQFEAQHPYWEWDGLYYLDTEVIGYRLKDTSEGFVRGVIVGMDERELKQLTHMQVREVFGPTFIELIKEGLPKKEPGQPYEFLLIT